MWLRTNALQTQAFPQVIKNMARLLAAVALLAPATGFVAPVAPASSSALRADASGMDGIQAPTGFFDPLGLSKSASDETLAWYRAAEIKHGRVAMAAFLGCVVTGVGAHFPGAVDLDGTSFASLADGDLFAAWDKMPADGKQQIVAAIGGIESVFEAQKPHYLQGGTPGKVRLTGTTAGVLESKYDAEKLASMRNSEIANGRLAMLAMLGFYGQHGSTEGDPIDNWLAHIADPWHVNVATNAIAVPWLKGGYLN